MAETTLTIQAVENRTIVVQQPTPANVITAGVRGPEGPAGQRGLRGERGFKGTGISFVDIIDGELICSFDDESHVNAGYVVGPQGPQGPAGVSVDGAAVVEETGQLRLFFTNGVQYEVPGNVVGASGTKWYIANGAPDASSPGVDGDYCLNRLNGDVLRRYTYDGAVGWQLMGNLKGPAGADGTPGAGLPSGGVAGQLLLKASSDPLDTVWADMPPSVSSWNDLTDKPSLSTVAISGAYSDLSGRPSLSVVANTGAYSDLTGAPATIGAVVDDAAPVLGGTLNGGGNIVDDVRLRDTRYVVTTANATGTYAFDLNAGNVFALTLTGNITALSFTNVPPGVATHATVQIKQDATGGRMMAGWPASVKWAEGTGYSPTATANAIDKVYLTTFDGGASWTGEYRKGYA